jgi:hypothetical protein
VRFVDEHQVSLPEVEGVPKCRLDSSHYNLVVCVSGLEPGRVNPDVHIRQQVADFVGILPDQFLAVLKHEHSAVVAFDGVSTQLGDDYAFAAPGWQHDYRIARL